jgi:hypothetical protein
LLRWLLVLAATASLVLLIGPFWWFYQHEKSMAPMRAEHARRMAEEKKFMSEPARTSPEDWRKLLQQLSGLAIADEIREELTPEQIESRWLGEPPATDEQIAAAEKRLGVALPPSYRAFLKVSNGWNFPNPFVARVAGTEEIGYLRDIDPDLIRDWNSGYDAEAVELSSGQEWPEKHLANTVLVNVPSDFDDGAYLMLNPATIHDGEMEAWFFSHWTPGADAYPSFWHLMASQAKNWPVAPKAGE